jgi:hypothetical protein
MAKKKSSLNRVISLVSIGLTTAAVVKELRLPAEERTWHGTVAGFVPYDLRVPTVDRLMERLWAPDNPHIFVPHVFGVGWTVNAGRVVALARDALASATS